MALVAHNRVQDWRDCRMGRSEFGGDWRSLGRARVQRLPPRDRLVREIPVKPHCVNVGVHLSNYGASLNTNLSVKGSGHYRKYVRLTQAPAVHCEKAHHVLSDSPFDTAERYKWRAEGALTDLIGMVKWPL
jgi:hypothetical protein